MGIQTLPTARASKTAPKVWNWSSPTTNSGAANTYSAPTQMVYANGIYACLWQGGTITYSTDLRTWSVANINSGATSLYGLAFGNGVWVVCGGSNTLYTSTNLTTWTARTSQISGSSTLYDVQYFSSINLFILTANTNAAPWNFVSTSTDGITWTARIASPSSSNTLSSAVQWDGASTFIITNSTATTSNAFFSTNGTTWTAFNLNGGSANNAAAYYIFGAYNRWQVLGSSRSSTTASITSVPWSTANGWMNWYDINFFRTSSASSNAYKGTWFKYDAVNNYYYYVNSSPQNYSGNDAAPVSLMTLDASVLATTYNSGGNIYNEYPIIQAEPIPRQVSTSSSNNIAQNNFGYFFLNQTHILAFSGYTDIYGHFAWAPQPQEKT